MVDPDTRYNMTQYALNGSGNQAIENIGYDSGNDGHAYDGVVDPVFDVSGNQVIDPQLDADHLPQNPMAVGHGHGAANTVAPASCG